MLQHEALSPAVREAAHKKNPVAGVSMSLFQLGFGVSLKQDP